MTSHLVWFGAVVAAVLLMSNSKLQQVTAQEADSWNATEAGNMTEADYYTIIFQDAQDAVDLPSANAPFGYRPGSATESNSCQQVRGVPRSLRSGTNMKPRGLANFYQKYTEAYGIPVLSSSRVPDNALRRACYTLRFLLAGHSNVRKWFYRMSGRVAVIGQHEGTNNIPEHSHLPNWWNQRARGLGGTPHAPVSSGGEENVLCYQSDRYRAQDIFLHESAHGVHLLGAAKGIPGWDGRLRALYRQSKARGLWANTYSMSTPEEYFAEGTQAYFYVQSYAPRPDGVRGPINTREKLKNYDPALYNMIKEVFPCDNTYLKRCESNRQQEDAQELLMNCDVDGGSGGGGDGGDGGGGDGGGEEKGGGGDKDCQDIGPHCAWWKSQGECTTNPKYMHVNCKKSCNVCEGEGGGGTGGGNCADKHTRCSYWASRGECQRNPNYMLINCMESCEKCTSTGHRRDSLGDENSNSNKDSNGSSSNYNTVAGKFSVFMLSLVVCSFKIFAL